MVKSYQLITAADAARGELCLAAQARGSCEKGGRGVVLRGEGVREVRRVGVVKYGEEEVKYGGEGEWERRV